MWVNSAEPSLGGALKEHVEELQGCEVLHVTRSYNTELPIWGPHVFQHCQDFTACRG